MKIKRSVKTYNGDFSIAVHPGEILQEMLDEHSLSQTRLAKHLKMDVSKINEICKGRRGVSADMAVLLAKALRVSAGTWMNLQKNWELSQVNSDIAKSIEPMRLQA